MRQLFAWRHLGRATMAMAMAGAMVLGSLGWASTGGAQAGETFLISDYGTEITQGNFCYRGWGFELNEDITVTSLIGGGVAPSTAAFVGAIWEGTYDAATDTLTFGAVVASVEFPDGLEQSVNLPTPVDLTAGRLYILGSGLNQEQDNDEDFNRVADFNSSTIAGPGTLFSSWLSPSDTEAFTVVTADEECFGAASEFTGQSVVVADNDTSTNPAIGFGYSLTSPPTTTTVAPDPTTTMAPTTTVVPAAAVVTPKFTG